MARRRKSGAQRRIISSQRLDMSVTQANGAIGRIAEVWEVARQARAKADYLQQWHDADIPMQDRPTLPAKAPNDLRKIVETAPTPYARSLVAVISQQMRVEDIRMKGAGDSAPAMLEWQRNGMDGKQIAIQRAALTHNLSYALVLPGEGRIDKKPTGVIIPRSARRATAFYRDDFDEFPEFYIDVDTITDSDGDREHFITFVDEAYIHYASCPYDDPSKLTYISNDRHDMEITPVQRFGLIDLDGKAQGEIEPVIQLLKRIDQDTTDRLVLQRFASWVVRTIAGMKQPADAALKSAMENWLAAGDFLSSDSPDTKFGHIPATPMDGHIRAREADLTDLSAVSQIPAYRWMGLSDNIGADAIEAADKSLHGKAGEYKTVLGESYEAMMRLVGHAAGNREIAEDFSSRVQWTVMESGSLQSVAQGLGILHEQLQVPAEMLWRRIGGWSHEDTEEAKALIKKERSKALLDAAAGLNLEDDEDGTDTGRAPGAAAPAGATATGD